MKIKEEYFIYECKQPDGKNYYLALTREAVYTLDYAKYIEADFNKALKMVATECTFDEDKRGGLTITLLDKQYPLLEIPDERKYLFSIKDGFLPIKVNKSIDDLVTVYSIYLCHFETAFIKQKVKYAISEDKAIEVEYKETILDNDLNFEHIFKVK